jgi:hypothetical protein
MVRLLWISTDCVLLGPNGDTKQIVVEGGPLVNVTVASIQGVSAENSSLGSTLDSNIVGNPVDVASILGTFTLLTSNRGGLSGALESDEANDVRFEAAKRKWGAEPWRNAALFPCRKGLALCEPHCFEHT